MKFVRNMIVASAAMATAAFGQTDLDLSLTATGTITAAPEWQDGASSVITTVAFDFAGIAGTVAGVDVDSASADVKIVNAADAGNAQTIALTRPTTCVIGANSVADANVHLVQDGTPRTADGNITFTEGATDTLELRFAAAGNHGTQSGAVSCSGAGQLRYTY